MSDLAKRVEQLETELTEMRKQQAERGGAAEREGAGERLSRRRLLGLGGAAVAGAAGAAIAAASPAGATTGNMQFGTSNNSDIELTTLQANSAFNPALLVQNISTNGNGVRGLVTGGSGTEGSATTGIGVSGAATTGTAVSGEATSGIGVKAKSTSGNSLRIVAPTSGDRGHMFLEPGGSAGPPTGGSPGEFWMDSASVLYQCVAVNTWVRLSAFVPLASPVRIYYNVTAGHPALGNGQERAVGVTNGTTIPHTASAVLTNLAVTPSGANGFLAMFKDGTTYPGHSNLNYTAGQFASNNATSAVSATSPAKVRIRCGGGAVNFVIDVLGYYL